MNLLFRQTVQALVLVLGGLGLLLGVAGCSRTSGDSSARSDSPYRPNANVWYVKLVHADTGKVLAVANDSDNGGARAVLALDEEDVARQWMLVPDGEHCKLVNRKSGKVLDVAQQSNEEGAPIIQWDDKAEGNDNQRWAWQGEGNERRLRSRLNGLVLDVDDEGKIVQRTADENATGQLWRVTAVQE